MLGWKEERWPEFQLLRPLQLAPPPRRDLPPRRALCDGNHNGGLCCPWWSYKEWKYLWHTIPIRIEGFTTLTVSNKLRPSRPEDWGACCMLQPLQDLFWAIFYDWKFCKFEWMVTNNDCYQDDDVICTYMYCTLFKAIDLNIRLCWWYQWLWIPGLVDIW